MPQFKTITDLDIGSDAPKPENFLERKASRGVVFDKENKVALFHSTKNHYHKLPGGGVDDGEDLEDALRRELREEIGCEIENIHQLGTIEEYRNKFTLHQFSYCYIANVVGEKGMPHLEEGEMAEGFVTEWMDLDSAIETLESEENVENYEGKFIQMLDLTFLKEVKKLN